MLLSGKKMVKIQTEVDGYRVGWGWGGGAEGGKGKGIHRNWMSRARTIISVIRVETVPNWCLVLL